MTSVPDPVAANPHWYHTIELAPGVVTPGNVDLRGVAPKVLPKSLTGLRALDIGTFDGFWAFELERRGAQTVAIDNDELDHAQWPPLNREWLTKRAEEWGIDLGRGFRIAAEALDSKVERVVCDVYDLTPEKIGGPVDVVFSGAIMLHLRDPIGALEAMLGVLKPGGRLIQMEQFDYLNTLRAPRSPIGAFKPLDSEFNWWLPNVSCLKAWPWAAGFKDVKLKRIVRPPKVSRMRGVYAVIESRRA